MSALALFLVFVSATIHAAWNLLSKSQYPRPAFFLVASLTGALVLSPVLLLHSHALREFPTSIWLWLMATGFAMAVYFVALAGSYRHGDLSVAYPLARSSPVIVVFVVAVLLGRSEQVSTLCMLGIVMVVAGCFLIPLARFTEFRMSNYLNISCAWALLAAIGTSGYSIIDDEALRTLRAHVPGEGPVVLTLIYGCLQALWCAGWLALLTFMRPKERATLQGFLRKPTPYPFLAGLAIYLAYALVLIALRHAENVSYVVGFRQISIPLGALLGLLVLKEPAHSPKLAGVGIMFAGLLLIAFG